MITRCSQVFTSLLLASLSGQALASEMTSDYRSARYLGMGDAGIALSEGHDALFYNPAGIADVKGLINEVVLVSPQIEASSNIKDLYTQISNNKPALEILKSIEGEPQHAAVQNYTGLVFRRSAIGVYERAQTSLFLGTDPVKGLLVANADVYARMGVHSAFGQSFFGDSLLVGLNLKFAQKNEGHITIDALSAEGQLKDLSPSSALSKYVKRGNGVGADFGLIWKLEDKSQTRLGVVVKNIGDLRYRWAVPGTSIPPPSDKQSVDIGASIAPQTKKSSASLAVDFRDALNANGESPYKRIHLGARLSFRGVLGFVAGLNQGYPTYGAFLNFKVLRTEVGTYSEELGKNPGDMRSRRIYGRIIVGWAQ
jgi:hypothetical protein